MYSHLNAVNEEDSGCDRATLEEQEERGGGGGGRRRKFIPS